MEDTQECVVIQVPEFDFSKFRVDSEQRKLVAYRSNHTAGSHPRRCVSRTEVRRIFIIPALARTRIRCVLKPVNSELSLLIISYSISHNHRDVSLSVVCEVKSY
jgi:hypothetical protein